jgi:hypothetical protein
MSGSRRSNAELLKQLEEKNPLLGLGCSYSPYPVRLWIQDMKNYYVDFYRFASKHVHFIHFKARSRLSNEVVAEVEDDLRDQVLKANEQIDEAIIQAEALMKAQGITLSVTDTPNCSPPLCHTAEVISPLTNRYIQLIEKTDYLLRALDPLFQQEVITMEEYNLRRGLCKRQVKRFYYACRRFDEGLRGRMDAREAVAATARSGVKGNGATSSDANAHGQATPVARSTGPKPRATRSKAVAAADAADGQPGAVVTRTATETVGPPAVGGP